MGLADGFLKVLGSQSRKPNRWLGKILFGHLATWGHRPLTNWAMGFMDIQPADYVLDVGCGGGMAIKLITKVATEGFVAGVDHSEIMVQQARKRNAAAVQTGRVEVRHGNVSALPYGDESFDKVCAIETFYFWPEPVANLEEVCRVLKPGGLVVLAMEGSKEALNQQKHAALAAQMQFPLYSGAEMVEMLTTAGFNRTWFEAVPPDKGWGWLCVLGVK